MAKYKEYFSKLFFTKYISNKNDTTEDIKDFKSDFYNPILKKLFIEKEYKKHFKNRELSHYDIEFLDDFFDFINKDSLPNESINLEDKLVRGIGSKSKRKNGRRIINNDLEPLYEDLIPILIKFDKALSENDKGSNFLDSHPIFQEAIKKQYLKSINNSISKIIDKLEELPTPFFNGIIEKFSPSFKDLISSFMKFVNEFYKYKNTNFISVSENPSKDELMNTIGNALSNLPFIRESSDIKQLNHQINPLKNKASYRNNQKTLITKKEERNNLIKDKLLSIGVETSADFQYQEDCINNYETLARLFPIIYNNLLQDGIPNVTFHFNDIN